MEGLLVEQQGVRRSLLVRSVVYTMISAMCTAFVHL